MQKIAMEGLNRPSLEMYKTADKLPAVFVLDNVRSGMNIGSVFRTADAFAWEKIILCGYTAQPPHREILKTALGSTDSVAWSHEDDLLLAIQQLRIDGFKIYALEQTEPRIWLHEFKVLPSERYAFILGNEVDGVQAEVLPFCDGSIEIPQYGTKHSLNVAVAAGVLAWEVTRKMREKYP
jgi:23S rRNA (guanosine2251-2'-O)-methyltransferase